MRILGHLTEKPWLSPGPHPWADSDGNGEDLEVTAGVALKFYFGVATVMFGLICAGYLMRGNHAGMLHDMPMDWRPLPKTWLLWYNTGILVLSSAAWHWAQSAARLGNRTKLQRSLMAGGVLSFVFLLGQLAAWRQLDAGGYFMAKNPAVAFFIVMIVLHGLHLIGGMFVWGRAMTRLSGETDPARLSLSVGLCAHYWHFLLVVWLVMFGVLLLG